MGVGKEEVEEEKREEEEKESDFCVSVDFRGSAILKEKISIQNPVVDFGIFRTLDSPFVVKVRDKRDSKVRSLLR